MKGGRLGGRNQSNFLHWINYYYGWRYTVAIASSITYNIQIWNIDRHSDLCYATCIYAYIVVKLTLYKMWRTCGNVSKLKKWLTNKKYSHFSFVNNKNADSKKNLRKIKFEWLILNSEHVSGPRNSKGQKNKQFSVLSLLMFDRMAFPLIELDSICQLAMFLHSSFYTYYFVSFLYFQINFYANPFVMWLPTLFDVINIM